MSAAYHSRVAVLNGNGDAIYHVHAELAQELVTRNVATIEPTRGRVRAVRLAQPAATHARRVGDPTPPEANGVRFYRWIHLEQSGTRVVEHHPRCFYKNSA